MKRILLTLTLALVASFASSRGVLLESDWQSHVNDSVPPLSFHQFHLDSYADASCYTVQIEYPELLPVSDSQLHRWGIVKDSLPEWPVVSRTVGVSRGDAVLDVAFMPLLQRDGKAFVIDSYKLDVLEQALAKKVSDGSGRTERYTGESVLAKGRWVKIRVTRSGIYGLSDSRLRSLGFGNPSKVKVYGYGGALLPETNLQNLPDDLSATPVMYDGSRLLFYAQGPEKLSYNTTTIEHTVNSYSDYGCYFLTDREDVPDNRIVPLECDSVFGRLVDSYPDCAFIDCDEFSWLPSGRIMFEKYDFGSGGSRTYQFDTRNMKSGMAYLTVSFSSSSSSYSSLDVQVGGNSAGTVQIIPHGSNDKARLVKRILYPAVSEQPDLSVKLKYDSRTACSSHLDFLRLEFVRRAVMGSSPYLRMSNKSAVYSSSFCVSASNPSVSFWKIEQSGRASVVPSVFRNDSTISYSSDLKVGDILLAVSMNASFPEPELVGDIENQNLHGLDSIDYVIVVPASGKITAQAERLAQAHRSIDSMKVAVVRADQVYNEFSSGTPDATALRRFMKMLYDRADGGPSAPRYLLLMGPGTWDNRMHTTDMYGCSQDDYLLCYESENSVSATESFVMEDYFGLLDDNEGQNLLTEKTDLGVGRLPVSDSHHAKVMVDRIIDYMTGVNAGKWMNEILVLGDDGDDNSHMTDADAVAELYRDRYPAKLVTKMYWDSYPMEVQASYNSYPTLRKRLLEKLDAGVLIVNYTGHGSTEVLSHELVMTKTDAASLSSPRLPFWITASCDIAPFDQPLANFGCNLMSNENGGAIGLLSTTRTVFSYQNKLINQCFSKYVLDSDGAGRAYALGDALMLAKNELVSTGGMTDRTANKLNYVLLADPALKLHRSVYTAVVDSFAHSPASGTGLCAQAGDVISVTGHIELDGVPQPDFNGTLYSTVFDNEREVTCLNNLKTAGKPFQYTDRDRVLFNGTDSVKSGQFGFSFPVPLDINYSDRNGLLNLFALSDDSYASASGNFTAFAVGGTASGFDRDSTGPTIGMYLNTPSFQYGADVNASPLLVIDLHDESGINTTGNGLGHEIVLVIDGDRSKTWVLDPYFVQDEGRYTDGTVMFRIPELAEGRHTLMVRAWDTMNNSSCAYLGFKVVSGLKPDFEITATQSPARESTEFVISHDRPMQDTGITVRIYDSRGELQWTRFETDHSRNGVAFIGWDLCNDSGQRVPPGLYLVRATVGQSGQERSVSCKIVVVNP